MSGEAGGPADLPRPPYYAVMFTSRLIDADPAGYGDTADAMLALAKTQPGYLGFETARDPATGLGISISYWTDLDAIDNWRRHVEHQAAKAKGRGQWYRDYGLRVARVERATAWRRTLADEDLARP